MKILVVYDTVSPQRMTAKVAETIAEALKGEGLEVDSLFVKDSSHASFKDYDCLIVGAPTMQWKPTPGIMQFLAGLTEGEFSGKTAAAFDTQVKSIASGDGTKGLEKKLRSLGFRLVSPPLKAYVEGRMNQYRLKEGEPEKAKAWAIAVAKAVKGKT